MEGNIKMKLNVLLRIFTTCIFIVSGTFSADALVSSNRTNICNNNFALSYSAVLYCMDKNTWNFGTINLPLNCAPFTIPQKCNTFISIPKYIENISSLSLSNELPVWYLNLLLCRSFFVIQKNYWSLFNTTSYESLPGNCKKLLNGNIEKLKSKCDIKSAQKLSVLTAINTSWEDALSAMKEIALGGALSHKYTLTEALFIIHLKPSQECTNNSVLNNLQKWFLTNRENNEYKEEDVLFYAECITGALACVLKHEGKIPSNFEFDILQTSDLEWHFLRNVKKLMQAYKDNFINEQKRMNKIDTNKKKVHNYLQEEEKCKLKQD